VKLFADYEQNKAIAFAKVNEQIAFYNLSKGIEIETEGF